MRGLVLGAAALAVLLAGVALSLRQRDAASSWTSEPVRWSSDGATIAGTLYVPAGEGPHPAAVLAPGYGDWTRDGELFRVHAERLAARGLAMLVYDKRGCGESTGDWRRATLEQLARDALGGHALLREDARIRGDAVGLFGTSQGGLIALIGADLEPAVAFVATLSLSTRSPAEHDAFLAGERVRRAGFEEHAGEAERLHARIVAAMGDTPAAMVEVETALLRVRDEPWVAAAESPLMPLDGVVRMAYRALPMDLDPVPLITGLDVPHFAAQGTADWVVPGERAARVLGELRDEHGLDLTLVVVDGAEHALRVPTGIGPLRGWTWPDAYWRALDAWLERVAYSSGSSSAASTAGSSSAINGERTDR